MSQAMLDCGQCSSRKYFYSEYQYKKDQQVGVELNYADVVTGRGPQQQGVVVRIDSLPASVRRGVAVRLN